MEGKTACSHYVIDMTAQEFGACKNCGLKKIAHNEEALPSTLGPPSQGSLKDKMKMFSQTTFTPSPANFQSNKKSEPKPAERKSTVKEEKKPVEPSKPVEKKSIVSKVADEEEEKPQACNNFKIDVAATEFNTCKNCHLNKKYHGAPGSSTNMTPSKPVPKKNELDLISKRVEELDRKEKERESQKKKEPEKPEVKKEERESQRKKEPEKPKPEVKKEPEKKPVQVEDEETNKKACNNFQIDVTGAFNSCKNCHLHRKFHDENAVTSGLTTTGSSLADRMQKFNNSNTKGPLPVPTDLGRKKAQTEYPLSRPSQPKKVEESEIIKGDTFSSNKTSNNPSQSVPIVEGVMSVKERMRLISLKKEVPKENLALKEIKATGASGVKALAGTLSSLGLLAPKIEEPPAQDNVEGERAGMWLENNEGAKEETKEVFQENKPPAEIAKPLIVENKITSDDTSRPRKRLPSKKENSFEFGGEEQNNINIKKKTIVIVNNPAPQVQPQNNPQPLLNPSPNVFNNPPEIKKELPKPPEINKELPKPPEIKKDLPKPPEIKKDPPKPPEIKQDNGLLKENPAANLDRNKKKTLFSDSSDSNSDDSDSEDDSMKKELRKSLAKMHSKNMNK